MSNWNNKYKKKKDTYNPYAKEIHAKLEAEKANRKNLRGYVVFKNNKSSADYKSKGIFLDESELNEYAKSMCKSLNDAASNGKTWKVDSINVLKNMPFNNDEDAVNENV